MSQENKLSEKVQKAINHLHRKELVDILRIQSEILLAMDTFMNKKGVVRCMPLMLSPFTDPLNHVVTEADINYAGQTLSMMKSMIFHKQVLLSHPDLEAIYIVSPNVRLETADRADDGRHLFEFTQIDYEFKNKDHNYVLSFTEEMIIFVFNWINDKMGDEIKALRGSALPIPSAPFKRYSTGELEEKYGEDYETISSKEATEPFWLFDHPREFYDKEDENNRGHYINYDIIWPCGIEEGLSGAEREDEYNQIVRRMQETKVNMNIFSSYVELAKEGLIPKTAGAGMGIERITRYVTLRKDIDEVTPFSRKPHANIVF